MFDIERHRRPSSREEYVPTDVGEPVGPGVASLPDISAFNNVNELVWSQVLRFPTRTNVSNDLTRIREIGHAVRRHYNSYNELKDAHRHLANGEIKAGIRSAASAIDAILRYYCDLWGVRFPQERIPYDEKIETVLRDAKQASYRTADAENLKKLLYLYRSRNSMHEGDCYYNDDEGNQVRVRSVDQVRGFVSAVEDFVVWIDALA
jgi:hypothetical protein